MFENPLVNNLTAVHYRRGQYAAALDQFTTALGLACQHDNLEYLLFRQAVIAMVHIRLGDARTARLLLEEAQTLVQTSGVLAALAAVMTNLARLELLERRPERALAWLDRAAPRSNEDHVYRGWVLGQTRLALGDDHGAPSCGRIRFWGSFNRPERTVRKPLSNCWRWPPPWTGIPK